VPAKVVLNALRPDDPLTLALLEIARHSMGWGAPLDVSDDNTVEVCFDGQNWHEGSRRLQDALNAAARTAGVKWRLYFSFRIPPPDSGTSESPP
jgi:hypothetical protein